MEMISYAELKRQKGAVIVEVKGFFGTALIVPESSKGREAYNVILCFPFYTRKGCEGLIEKIADK